MFKIFHFIRKYSFALVIMWMALYAFDLIDDLRNNYVRRPSSEVVWMLITDFIRCFLVIGIWIASNFDPDKRQNK